MSLSTTKICQGIYQVRGTNAFIVRVDLIAVGTTPASTQWALVFNDPYANNQDSCSYHTKREALTWLLNNQEIAVKEGLTLS